MKQFEIRKNGVPVACGTRRAMDAVGALYGHATLAQERQVPIYSVYHSSNVEDRRFICKWRVANGKTGHTSTGRAYAATDLMELLVQSQPHVSEAAALAEASIAYRARKREQVCDDSDPDAPCWRCGARCGSDLCAGCRDSDYRESRRGHIPYGQGL